jgi:His-Xaa-Ser system protein HxsD
MPLTPRTTLAPLEKPANRQPLDRQGLKKPENYISGFFLQFCLTSKHMTELVLDSSVYGLEAVQKAAYRFIDRLTVVISQSPGKIECHINPIEGRKIPLEKTIEDFKRELLDQQLRVQIKEETEPVRNLILALAFSKTGLQK